MDIPVSRLNERMALRLPAQFPLGLVFVVGTVEGLGSNSNKEGQPLAFYLSENDCRLRCTLSERAAIESDLKNGYRIRAGGHLEFDSKYADYYLLARDVEIIPLEQPRASSMAAIIADYSKRSEQAGLVPAELPDWVQRMAPYELRQDAQRLSTVSADTVIVEPVVRVEGASTRPPGLLGLGHEVAVAGLSDELIEFLSEAMDSEEEIELTPEMVADFNQMGGEGNAPAAGSNSGAAAQGHRARPSGYDQQIDEDLGFGEDEEKGRGKKRTYIWVVILVLMIIILLLGATFILTEFVL